MAKRVYGFSENDHQRVSRAVKRVEAMRDTRNRRQRRFSVSEGIPFYNNSNSVAPLGAAMKVVGTTIISGTKYLEIIQPDGYDLHDCVINLTADVGYQQTGRCTYGPAKIYCTDNTTLEPGHGLGTSPNSWSVTRGYGFRYIANQDTAADTATAERYGNPGYSKYGYSSSPITITGTVYLPDTSSNQISFGEYADSSEDGTLTFRHSGLYSVLLHGVYGLDTAETKVNPPSSFEELTIKFIVNGDTTGLNSQFSYNNGQNSYDRNSFSMQTTIAVNAGDTLQISAESGTPKACIRRYSILVHRINSR